MSILNDEKTIVYGHSLVCFDLDADTCADTGAQAWECFTCDSVVFAPDGTPDGARYQAQKHADDVHPGVTMRIVHDSEIDRPKGHTAA